MSLQSLLQPLDCRPGREAYQFLVGQHDVADPPCLRLVLGGTYRLARAVRASAASWRHRQSGGRDRPSRRARSFRHGFVAVASIAPAPRHTVARPDAAPSPLHPVVAGWRGEFENLPPHASPCRNLPPGKWATIRESALAFCDQFGNEAHRLGWTAPELFAVHPQHETIRLDACGALMLGGEAARGVEANRVVFERTSGYRNGPGRSGASQSGIREKGAGRAG